MLTDVPPDTFARLRRRGSCSAVREPSGRRPLKPSTPARRETAARHTIPARRTPSTRHPPASCLFPPAIRRKRRDSGRSAAMTSSASAPAPTTGVAGSACALPTSCWTRPSLPSNAGPAAPGSTKMVSAPRLRPIKPRGMTLRRIRKALMTPGGGLASPSEKAAFLLLPQLQPPLPSPHSGPRVSRGIL